MKIKHLMISLLAIAVAGTAMAQEKGSQSFLSTVNGSVVVQSLDDATRAPAGTAVDEVVDMTGIESWDEVDDLDNIVIELNIGDDMAMTGFSFDVGIASVGASWLSEATVLFSDSTGSADPNGIVVNPGAGNDASGDQEFSSGGVVSLSDNDLPDVAAGVDGILRLEFFESFDDVPDAVDANWRNAATPAVVAGLGITLAEVQNLPPPPAVPTLSLFGLLALALVLALGTALVLRRKA